MVLCSKQVSSFSLAMFYCMQLLVHTILLDPLALLTVIENKAPLPFSALIISMKSMVNHFIVTDVPVHFCVSVSLCQ